MLTADELRMAFKEADASVDADPPRYIRWLERAWVFLVPTEDDGSPILCRCRCCGSICVTALGPDGHMPDPNLGLHTHVPTPCGYCRPVTIPRGLTLQGVRERAAAGQPLGIGR